MPSLGQQLNKMLNPFATQGPVPTSGVNRGMSAKYLSSMIGTAGAGKTTIASLVFLTARTLQQNLPDFYCDLDDSNSTIMYDVARMESGHFPPKTKAYNTYAYQAALDMWWGKHSLFGQKSATFQVCDIAGEDLVAQSQYNVYKPDPIAYSQAANLVDHVNNSDIVVPTAPASRAPMFDGDAVLEYEESDELFNPDVRLASVLGMLINRRKQQNRPFKGIALCLTKCDMVDKYVEKKYGWDLYHNEHHRALFLDKYFPWTTMKIKALKDTWSQTEVITLPMFVETEKDSAGNQKRWETGIDQGNPKIAVKDRNVPYNAQACVELINFIGRLVG